MYYWHQPLSGSECALSNAITARAIEGYITCIDFIRLLFKIKDFISSTPDFNINVSGNLLNEVRLSYFTRRAFFFLIYV